MSDDKVLGPNGFNFTSLSDDRTASSIFCLCIVGLGFCYYLFMHVLFFKSVFSYESEFPSLYRLNSRSVSSNFTFVRLSSSFNS